MGGGGGIGRWRQEESEVQDLPWLFAELEASLGPVRPWLKKTNIERTTPRWARDDAKVLLEREVSNDEAKLGEGKQAQRPLRSVRYKLVTKEGQEGLSGGRGQVTWTIPSSCCPRWPLRTESLLYHQG